MMPVVLTGVWFDFLCHRLQKYGTYSGEANTATESIGNNSSSNRWETSACACARSIIVNEKKTFHDIIFMVELIKWL